MASKDVEARLTALEEAIANLEGKVASVNPQLSMEDRVARLELALKGEYPKQKGKDNGNSAV